MLLITDKNRLRPDTVDEVMRQYPFLVDYWQDEGRTIYTIANNLQTVRDVRTFFERAIRLGREVLFE